MRHVLFCGLALRAALVLPVVALALIAATVDAQAAAVTGNSGATVCTGGPIMFDYNQPGNCAFSGSGAATFLGQFNTPAVAIDQSVCPNQATDGTDTICGHFGMDFSNVHGTVTVAISFDANNDLDLCITDATAFVIVTCSKGSKGTETLTFNVSCTDTRYEAQILPISFGSPGPPLIYPATYNGNVSAHCRSAFPVGARAKAIPSARSSITTARVAAKARTTTTTSTSTSPATSRSGIATMPRGARSATRSTAATCARPRSTRSTGTT